MWIIPKTLSAFVPATPGWSLESSEQAWMFAQSVTWRSKFMSKQYWLKRFKKGDYVQHLSGLTLSPSMHDRFVESWTESQEASHVSHFQAPENEKDKKTQGTYGQASQTLFDFADPDGSSSKTCQDWLPLGCVTSCKTWDKWVIERRGIYSVRKKLARHTKGNECSSWQNYPTPTSRDWKGKQANEYKDERGEENNMKFASLPGVVDKISKSNWATPQASDHIEGARTAKESNQKCLGRDLNQMKNWATPQGRDHLSAESKEKWEARAKLQAEKGVNLHLPLNTQCQHIMEEQHNGLRDQEKSNTSGKNQGSWLTPKSRDYRDVENHILRTGENVRKTGQKFSVGLPTQAHMKEFPEAKKAQAKLNPNWVEQLMGLPIGWTDLGSWGMELSHKQQN